MDNVETPALNDSLKTQTLRFNIVLIFMFIIINIIDIVVVIIITMPCSNCICLEVILHKLQV